MAIKVTCPHCGKTGNVPDTVAGKSVRCPRCQSRFGARHPDHGTTAEVVADERSSVVKSLLTTPGPLSPENRPGPRGAMSHTSTEAQRPTGCYFCGGAEADNYVSVHLYPITEEAQRSA